MRLLHTRELRFEDFYNNGFNRYADERERITPPYAILSHRWGRDEVSYQEFLALTATEDLLHPPSGALLKSRLETIRAGRGFQKILKACILAADQQYEWIWIDTCCIDKTSSSELTEAINSMFNWYSWAAVCYAYLADVEDASIEHSSNFSSLAASEWFVRGWTLQELLAPSTVMFYDAQWRPIGEKHELGDVIGSITKINKQYLVDPLMVTKACVATKMRWAANRKTTRIEDEAYCLLGLFDVNMPLLYGEGPKAFQRLQKTIIEICDDCTILAHLHRKTPLAEQPADFLLPITVSPIWPWGFNHTCLGNKPFAVTNKGVTIQAAFVNEDKTVIALQCTNQQTRLPFLLPIARRAKDWWMVADMLDPDANEDVQNAEQSLAKYVKDITAGRDRVDPFTYEEINLSSFWTGRGSRYEIQMV